MKLFPISDVHVEFQTEYKEHSMLSTTRIQRMFSKELGDGSNTVLLACGDIGTGLLGLFWCTQMLQAFPNLHICYVPGNHEFYGHNMYTLIREYVSIMKSGSQPRLSILDGVNNSSVNIYNTAHEHVLTVIGGTLWTSYNNGNETVMKTCLQDMNDYKTITIGKENHNITPNNLFNIHCETRKNMFKAINKAKKDVPVVCMSHHTPYADVTQSVLQGKTYWAYYSDLSEQFNKSERVPQYWFHGHTHKSYVHKEEYTNGSCIFVSNQVGYPSELETGYSHLCTWEI